MAFGLAHGFTALLFDSWSYERSEVVQCYKGVCQKFCNTVYRGSFWCIL